MFHYRRLLIPALALSAISTSFAAELSVASRLSAKLKPSADRFSVAAALASGYGKVHSRSNDGSWVIELKAGLVPATVLRAWKLRPSVESATSLPPASPNEDVTTGSLRRAEEFADQYKKAYLLHYEAIGEKPEDEIPGLDFLEAYIQHLQVRAYPGDTIDFTGHRKVIEERMASLGEQRAASTGWEFIGPTNLDIPYRTYYGQRAINGRVGALAYHPTNPNTIFLGGAQGGLWKSTDKGVNWTPMTDDWPMLHVSAIAIEQFNSNVIYVGTGDYHGFSGTAMGIMKTTDGGATWTRLGATEFGNSPVSTIVISPDNPQTLVASCGLNGGGRVYRSTDGGLTWSVSINVNADWDNLELGMPIAGNRQLWAVSQAGGIRRSSDFGATWSVVSVPGLGTGTLDLACSKVDPQVAYLLDGGGQRIFKTTNNGTTWTNTTNNFPTGYNWSQSWYDWHILTSYFADSTGNHDVVYVGLIDVVMSRNGGATWRNMGGSNWSATYNSTAITHNDQHCAVVNGTNLNEVLIGNDGGCYIATFNPAADTISWSNLNRNLAITQFYTLATHPTNANVILGGTQDNASPHARGDLLNWDNPGAGDGAGCAIDPSQTATRYDSYQGQNIRRTDNSYSSSYNITPSWSGHSTPFIGMLWLDRTNSRYLYANTNFMNRYDRSTNSWVLKLGNFNFGTTNLSLDTAVGDSNTIYVGTSTGRIYVSRNFGANWTSIDRVGQGGGIPNRAVTWLSVNPSNKNDVLAVLSGTGTGKVWRCTDTTAASPQWTNVGSTGAGMPDVPANCIERHPNDPQDVWFVGTDVGAFKTVNSGATWTDVSSPMGLPNVEVTRLVAVPGTGYLQAATFGRGMWRMPLTDPEQVVVPTVLNVQYGRIDSGNVASLASEDGSALRMCKFIVPNSTVAPVTVEVEAANPVPSYIGLRLAVRFKMGTVGSYNQTLDMYNWTAAAFDSVDVRTDALTTTYQTVELIGTGTVSRYTSGTGQMRARYRIVQTGPTAIANWCIDHDRVNWIVTP